MADFNSMVGSMEKLNEYNYRDWRTCMKFYLKGQGLWEVVDGSQTSPPNKEDKSYESLNIKANKAMYILMTSMEKNVRSRIAHVEIPKEAWDILASLFSNKNTARLQLLEKEVMNTTQGTFSVKEYFSKVKNLCHEIEEIDPEAKFGEGRIRRIIINGLNSEYNSYIAAIQGWQKQPSLVELENLLVDQEALSKRMSKVTIKQETEEALFSARRPNQKFKKGDYNREHNGRRSNCRGHKSDSDDEEELEKEDHRQHRQIKRGECLICGRKGHYARECKFLKKIQSNFVKIEHKDDASEEEWDFEATYAVNEDACKEEWDFEATYAVDEEVAEEEDWEFSKNCDELWIEDLETDDNSVVAANSEVVKAVKDQNEDNMAAKIEDKDVVVVKETEGFILSQKEMKLVAIQPDWLVDAGMIVRTDNKEAFATHEVKKQGEPDEEVKKQGELDEKRTQDYSRMNIKIKDHSKKRRDSTAEVKIQERLMNVGEIDQVKQDKFDVGVNMKRPPDKDEQLGIKGEY